MTQDVVELTNAPLDPDEYRLLVKLTDQWKKQLSRNKLRTLYHDGERSLRAAGKLGFAMPPELGKLESVVGWPGKAVEVLDNRLDLQGFVSEGAAESNAGIDEIVEDNDLLVESSMAHIASMTHGVSFVGVSAGDPALGEPPAVITTRDATEATALYSVRSRRVVAGLTINEGLEGLESPQITLWMDDRVVTIWREGRNFQVRRQTHSMGRTPMVMLPYRPRLGKRYGMSRISRALMDTTDSAARTIIRMEGTAEFFSFPQRWATGVDQADFDDVTFTTYLNRLLALGTVDDDGHQPALGQFSAQSPEPHIAQLRASAMMASGETGIPADRLGIIQDNPSSADAIRAQESELVKIAERSQMIYGHGWVDVVRMAQHARDGMADDSLGRLRSQWRSAATATKAADAQSTMTLVSSGVLEPKSEITWELLGLDPVTVSRLKAEALRNQGENMLDQLLAGTAEAGDEARANVVDEGQSAETPKEDPAELKQRADALGSLIRAGVTPENAAQIAGLPQVKFIGGRPITLKYDEDYS